MVEPTFVESEVFSIEGLVIITSNDQINMLEWRKYLENNWAKFSKYKARLLVLAGIHGEEEGKMGDNEYSFVKTSEKQIEKLKKHKENDIKEKEMEIKLVNIGLFKDKSLDEEQLIKAIQTHEPTILLLAYCFSQASELNDILRAAGM